ncbi:ABC transporter permease [Leifsonia xyli]|nr:ABC transporter permease [Leifsonia xyli]
MTVATQPAAPAPTGVEGEPARVMVRHWRLPIAFAAFGLVSILLFLVFPRSGETTYTFTAKNDFFAIPNLPVHTLAAGFAVTAIALAITVAAFVLVAGGRRVPLWLGAVFAFALLFGFVTWSAGSGTVPVAGLLAAALGLSVPIIYGALGGVLSERVGVVNVAIEGQLLGGAFTSAILATMTHSAVVGLIGAAVAGALVSFVLAAFSIKYLVDQVIFGIVLNVLVSGVTGFFYTAVMANNTAAFNLPPTLPSLPIPLLSQIPVIGPVLFDQTFIVYAMYVAVAGVSFFLFHTRWGLRVRAVGEHPKAADTVGVKVASTRFWTVLIAGAIAGFGGAYFTIGGVGGFVKDMTSGLGYIALAAVIFGRWNPIRATLAALLFGFAAALQSLLDLLHAPIPSEFLRMLPYLVTIVAVAGLVGISRGPAASGKPYIKS